jgi:CheY-like chemotaxis protein/PAS domain-containing protein
MVSGTLTCASLAFFSDSLGRFVGGGVVPERPRILVLESPGFTAKDFAERTQLDAEVVAVDNLGRCLRLLRTEHFDGVYGDPRDAAVLEEAKKLLRAERILDALADGVAVVNADLQILWANPAFEKWCGGPAQGRAFYEALGSPEILGPDYSPFHTALAGSDVITRLHCRDNRYLELHIAPIHEPGARIGQLISLARDVTAEVLQQQKLDALHKAGRELAALAPEELADMSVEERVELLKANIRKFTHDLLHYDVIEIRLLDRATGKLDLLLQEGMTPEATQRELYAETKGNGITGYAAATGKSYLCLDTTHDPLYIRGAADARSSLTVPLIVSDQVIGTFNVESPRPNAFGDEDVQFAEIFSRELAASLHTLELLWAEKRCTTSQSVEAISREVALPVDDILAAGTAVLERYIGHEPEMSDKLRKILASARAIKQSIQKVGEDLSPAGAAPGPDRTAHPRLRGMRLLVADNDERVRRTAHSILGRFGCVVETARDGQEALTMARLGAYDAILTDIRLPDLSGYEVYRKLREAQPQSRIVLMTAYGYDPTHSIVNARKEGLGHVLYKPFRVDQLLDALENEPAPAPAPALQKPETVRA